jgi:hypothetical protein
MTTIPPECQPIADRIAGLKASYNGGAEQANAVTGAPVWPLLAQLADLRSQLGAAESEFQTCISNVESGATGTYDFAPIRGEAVVIDARIAPTALGTQIATLWEFADAGALQKDRSTVSEAGFVFNTPVSGTSAVTVGTNEGGPDPVLFFRSGTLDTFPAQLHLEVVLVPDIRITAGDLDLWLASLVPVDVPLRVMSNGAEVVDGSVTVTALSYAREEGVLGVAMRGSLSGTAWGIPLSGTEISGTLRCAVTPATSGDARYPLEINRAEGGSTLNLTGSVVAMVADPLLGVAMPFVENTILDLVRSWIDTAQLTAVRNALLLAELPPDATLTIRYIQIDEAGLTISPALGAVGTALTTYDPPPVLAL